MSSIPGLSSNDEHDRLRSLISVEECDDVPSEFNLLYLCFFVLGNQMKHIRSIGGIIEAALDKVVATGTSNTNSDGFFSLPMLQLLLRLSNFAQAQETMYARCSGLIHQLLTARAVDDTDQTTLESVQKLKEIAAEISRNLARCPGNKVLQYQQMAEALFDSVLVGETFKVQRFALGALNNLATLDENAIALLRKPLFLEAVLECTQKGGTRTIKERALWTLQSMACADENEVLMFEFPHLMETLVMCLNHGETNEIKSYAMETLRNLSNRNQVAMFGNRDLLNALFNSVQRGETPVVRNLGLSCFQRMGIPSSRVKGSIVFTALCSVRVIPRVCLPGCAFQQLPLELIQLMGQTLFDGD